MGKLKKNLAIFIAIFSLLAFIVFLPSVFKINTFSDFDLLISENVSHFWSDGLTTFFLTITGLGNIFVLLALSIILLLLLISRRRFYESFVLLSSILAGSLSVMIFKEFTKVPRLENSLIEELSFSFPSGHTAMTTIFFLTLGYLLRDRIKNLTTRLVFEVVCVCIIVLVGFSRIYLGVHRPTEVVAGFLLGTFCVSLSIVLGHIFVMKK